MPRTLYSDSTLPGYMDPSKQDTFADAYQQDFIHKTKKTHTTSVDV